MMKGLFVISPNNLRVLDLEEPQLGDYDALVQVQACGICNSTDWKVIEGRFKKGSFPILLGHESAGIVIRTAKKVRNFAEGDRVLRARLYDKDISIPGASSRWGGFAQKAVVTDVWAQKGIPYGALPHPQQKVPLSIPPEQAAAMIVLKENLNYVKKTDIHPGHSLAIVGTGPAGQSMTLWAKFLGVAPVVVFGRRGKWAALFEELGADAYVAGEEVPAEVRSILDSGGFDRSIEAVGSNAALKRCLGITKDSGRVHLYGMPADDEPYDQACASDPRVFRSPVLEAEVHEEVLRYVEQGRIDLDRWLSHVLPWREYQRAFDIVKEEKPTKVVIEIPANGDAAAVLPDERGVACPTI
jgi:threonine dehydrogenase-like Zn-dependent dehydrogenase